VARNPARLKAAATKAHLKALESFRLSRWIWEILALKPEPFLHEAQKKFGTHASFNSAKGESWCRAERLDALPDAESQ
jgi:hypothetical protein